MKDSDKDMYWAGFVTMFAIVGLIFMLHIGISLDKSNNSINSTSQTSQVV